MSSRSPIFVVAGAVSSVGHVPAYVGSGSACDAPFGAAEPHEMGPVGIAASLPTSFVTTGASAVDGVPSPLEDDDAPALLGGGIVASPTIAASSPLVVPQATRTNPKSTRTDVRMVEQLL